MKECVPTPCTLPGLDFLVRVCGRECACASRVRSCCVQSRRSPLLVRERLVSIRMGGGGDENLGKRTGVAYGGDEHSESKMTNSYTSDITIGMRWTSQACTSQSGGLHAESLWMRCGRCEGRE